MGLFIKLIEREIPLVFLEIVMTWYDGLLCRVKWGDQYSNWFEINAGVRQGGVLSTDFYSIYVGGLLSPSTSSLSTRLTCYETTTSSKSRLSLPLSEAKLTGSLTCMSRRTLPVRRAYIGFCKLNFGSGRRLVDSR